MKISKLFGPAIIAVVLAFATTGCATFRTPAAATRPITYALVVSVSNGQPPTEAQWAMLQKQFATLLAARGFALVSNPATADRIIHVRYVPDIINPDDPTLGNAVVMSVKNNAPAVAANVYRPTSASYGPAYNSVYNAFSDDFNYYTPMSAVYTPGTIYAPGAGTPPPPIHLTPPPHSTKPDDCPPINFAGNYPIHITPRPGSDHPTHSRPEPSYSRSDSNYSRSDSNYSRSESSSSSSSGSVSSSFTPAASYSAPSYSPPAPSESSSASVSSSFSPASSYSESSSSPPAPSSSEPSGVPR